MKIVVVLLTLFTVFSCNTASQDSPLLGLPDGVKARLGKGAIGQIRYSPDGTRLAVGSGINIWLYDTTTHQEVALLTAQAGFGTSVGFSPDGRTLASGDADTGTHHRTLKGHRLYVASLAFNPIREWELRRYRANVESLPLTRERYTINHRSDAN